MSTINPFEILESKMDQVLEAQRATQKILSVLNLDEERSKTLNFREAMDYVDLSESYGRLLCHKKEIPFYKPRGRRLYFVKSELDEWLQQGKSFLTKS